MARSPTGPVLPVAIDPVLAEQRRPVSGEVLRRLASFAAGWSGRIGNEQQLAQSFSSIANSRRSLRLWKTRSMWKSSSSIGLRICRATKQKPVPSSRTNDPSSRRMASSRAFSR